MKNYLKCADYPLQKNSFHHYAMKELICRFNLKKSMCILDLGVGMGHCVIPLCEMGFKKLYGADIDPYNKELIESKGIKFLQMDVTKDQLGLKAGSVDAVLSFHLIEHLQDPSAFFSEIKRVLTKSGLLLLVTPDWRRQFRIFYRDPSHLRPYDKESMARLFKMEGFEILQCTNFGALTGIGATGLWKIVPSLMFTGRDLICVGRKTEPKG